MTDIVFYYANHNKRYLAMAYQSIESLRRYNRDVRVLLFTERSAVESVRANFKFENFSAKVLTTNNRNPLRNKWLCVAAILEIAPERAMLLDVDTIFYDDVAKLFTYSRETGAPLVARQEVESTPGEPSNIIFFDRFAVAQAAVAAQEFPVFNTGVILMDRRGARMIHDGIPFVFGLMNDWKNYPERNPCIGGLHIAEEVAYAVYLGTRPDSRYAFLPPRLAPFFQEVSLARTKELGVLIHYWNRFMSLKGPNPYAEFEGSLPSSKVGGVLP